MKKFVLLFNVMLFILVYFTTVSLASPDSVDSLWQTDFDAALLSAQKTDKDLLLSFSGSDWCPWCKKLEKEVFTQDLFKQNAPKNYILVNLDFPKKTKLPDALKNQNEKLQNKYKVTGFPTILLTDSAGEPYAQLGYRQGGPQKYLDHLALMRSGKTKWETVLKKASSAQGLEKANLYDQGLELKKKNGLIQGSQKIIDEIKALDKDNAAGLKNKYEIPEKMALIEKELNTKRDFDKALQGLSGIISAYNPDSKIKQDIYMFQAAILIKGKKDNKAGLEALNQALKIAPDTEMGKRIPQIIEMIEKSAKP
jgi:thioredoxin-related protein